MAVRTMDDDAVGLLRRALRIDTSNPPGRERELAELLAGELDARGVPAELLAHGDDRASVVARVPGGNGPALVLSGHLDVVPAGADWSRDPFGAEIVDDRLYGRGASDMKAGVVAIALAAARCRDVRLPGDLVVALTAGEEADCLGARAVAAAHAGPVSGVVVAEPTNNRLALAEKGALWLAVTLTGRAAHGAMPQAGASAIELAWSAAAALHELDLGTADPLLGAPTATVTRIEGGSKVNVVPDRCRMEIDVRTVPAGPTHAAIVAALRQRVNRMTAADSRLGGAIGVLVDRPPVTCPEDDPLARVAVAAVCACGGDAAPIGVPYFTDGAIYGPAWQAPVLIAGPGDPAVIHQPDEHVSVTSFLHAIDLYERLVRAWCNVSSER